MNPKEEGHSFAVINSLLQSSWGYGRLFVLLKEVDGTQFDSAVDVFKKKEGVYIIHSLYFHQEDVGFSHAEPIHHYIVYNAGTRVLFLYPEVQVCLLYAYIVLANTLLYRRCSFLRTKTSMILNHSC